MNTLLLWLLYLHISQAKVPSRHKCTHNIALGNRQKQMGGMVGIVVYRDDIRRLAQKMTGTEQVKHVLRHLSISTTDFKADPMSSFKQISRG